MFVRNTVLIKQERERPVLAGQSEPFFEPARLSMTTPALFTEVPAQNFIE